MNDYVLWFIVFFYKGWVYELVVVGLVVLQVMVLDKDKGKNVEVLYLIELGNIGNFFMIDFVLGFIKIVKELD